MAGVEVAVKAKGTKMVITPVADPDEDLELELFSAQERSDLLADALGLAITIAEPGG